MAGCAAAAISAVLLLAFAGSARAATTIGQIQGSSFACTAGVGQVQDVSPIYSIPFDGVITSFAASGSAGEQTKLLILQPVSGTIYNVAAKSGSGDFTAYGARSFPTRLTARAGQLIGNYGYGCYVFSPGTSFHTFLGPEPATGADQDFLAAIPDSRIELSATLELDADHDGFGDESQDQCPTNATTQGPCPQAAPTTPTTSKRKDPKCEHLRKKLKRQMARLEKADTDEKRSMIQTNIEDTHRRLEKLGC